MNTLKVIEIILLTWFAFYLVNVNTNNDLAQFHDAFAENASLNVLLDNICENLKTNGKDIGLEPLKLPDLLESFTQHFWIIGTFVEVYNLTNGTLYNLETLHRYGDSLIAYENQTLDVELELEVDNIKVKYLLDAFFNGHELKGILHGELKMLRIKAAVAMETDIWNITLKELSFPNPGSLYLSIETSILLSWLINSVLKIVTTLFETPIMNHVQEIIEQTIKDYLKHFPSAVQV
ncbi:hypothetical protein O3M35_010829 [Rhynocoris fuscipes]|uniref:Uncharacterized protein n=1 Tax=Rhynocoris fuscipes TaxID=488301 RepID=A0AAW1D1W9_9HEMI